MEPTLVGEFWAHIIGLVSAMARGMERSPGNYASWNEEQLRDALLVLLNAHYEGQATGETFNASGKTDIIVRVEDCNVFVGECKWWAGPAAFAVSSPSSGSASSRCVDGGSHDLAVRSQNAASHANHSRGYAAASVVLATSGRPRIRAQTHE